MKNIYFIIISALAMLYMFHEIRKNKFSIQESFWWMMAAIVMLILSIFPYSIDKIAKLFGITYPPSLLFVFCIIFLIFIIFRNSKRITEQQEKITELAQNLAILKEKVDNIKNYCETGNRTAEHSTSGHSFICCYGAEGFTGWL